MGWHYFGINDINFVQAGAGEWKVKSISLKARQTRAWKASQREKCSNIYRELMKRQLGEMNWVYMAWVMFQMASQLPDWGFAQSLEFIATHRYQLKALSRIYVAV